MQELDGYLRKYQLTRQSRIYRTDAYHWVAGWRAPAEPVNVFISPPFADLNERNSEFLNLVGTVMERVPAGSVVVVQAEEGFPAEKLADAANWDYRKYGRNLLLIWVKSETAGAADPI